MCQIFLIINATYHSSWSPEYVLSSKPWLPALTCDTSLSVFIFGRFTFILPIIIIASNTCAESIEGEYSGWSWPKISQILLWELLAFAALFCHLNVLKLYKIYVVSWQRTITGLLFICPCHNIKKYWWVKYLQCKIQPWACFEENFAQFGKFPSENTKFILQTKIIHFLNIMTLTANVVWWQSAIYTSFPMIYNKVRTYVMKILVINVNIHIYTLTRFWDFA